jgi:hypothetical protein
MYFHSPRKRVQKLELKINNTSIESVTTFNFLGLMMNCNLTWKTHINTVCKKISKINGILTRLKHTLPLSALTKIYNALVLPHINYCILTWDHKTGILELTQKKVLRTIVNGGYRSHTEPICKELNILKIQDIYKVRILKFFYCVTQNTMPSYFQSFIPAISQGANLYSFRSNVFQIPKHRHEFVKSTLRYQLVDVINSTPTHIINMAHTHSLYAYGQYIKTNITNNYSSMCVNVDCFICRP